MLKIYKCVYIKSSLKVSNSLQGILDIQKYSVWVGQTKFIKFELATNECTHLKPSGNWVLKKTEF